MDPLILTTILAIVAKNLIETLKHLANVGGAEDGTYTRLKGLYAVGAPILLAALAAIAEQNGVAIDLLGAVGVETSSPLFAAIVSGLAAGFVAPEAYDAQGLLKARVAVNKTQADQVERYGEAIVAQHVKNEAA